MTVSKGDIIELTRQGKAMYAVVTGTRQPHDGEKQIFMRTLEDNDPQQVTSQDLEFNHNYTYIGEWNEDETIELVQDVNGIEITPKLIYDLIDEDELPTYT